MSSIEIGLCINIRAMSKYCSKLRLDNQMDPVFYSNRSGQSYKGPVSIREDLGSFYKREDNCFNKFIFFCIGKKKKRENEFSSVNESYCGVK